jgi:NhaP-type Na+/H+ or K+/H+ antiporter
VALAIVLSLPQFGQNRMLENVVIGAVLFTLFIEGLSIEPLVKLLGLHKPALADRFALHQHLLGAKEQALKSIEEFTSREIFSAQIISALKKGYKKAVEEERERRTGP